MSGRVGRVRPGFLICRSWQQRLYERSSLLGPTLDRARLAGDDLSCMSVEDADHLVDPEAPKAASIDGAAGERGAGNAIRMAHHAAKATAASGSSGHCPMHSTRGLDVSSCLRWTPVEIPSPSKFILFVVCPAIEVNLRQPQLKLIHPRAGLDVKQLRPVAASASVMLGQRLQ